MPRTRKTIRRTCLIFLTAIAAAARAKTIVVPDESATLQAALEAASAGDTIQLKPGRYAGPFKFKPGITLNGEERDGVILSSPSKDAPVIEITNCATGAITNLTVEWKSPRGGGNIPPPVIKVAASSIEIRHCKIKGGFGDGIEVQGEGHPVIDGCEISGNMDGIFALGPEASVTAINNHILNNRDDGIELREGSSGILHDNVCEKNASFGININGAGTRSDLRDNTLSEQLKNGILIYGGAEASIRGNHCLSNKCMGIYVQDDRTSVTMIANECIRNSLNGIYIEKGASAVLEENTCRENAFSGISIWFQDSRGYLKGNDCSGNKMDGIDIGNGANATAAQNVCNDNDGNGIVVVGFETSPVLTENQCARNKVDGIKFGDESSGEARRNTCRGNTRYGLSVRNRGTDPTLSDNVLIENGTDSPDRTDDAYNSIFRQEEIEWLFRTERFKRLDGIASRLRERKSRYPSSEWQLKFFYDFLKPEWQKDSRATLQKKVEITKRWIAASPKSITPRVALVEALKDLGWDYRGSGNAGSVTDEGWKQFYANINQAQAAATDAAKLSEKDPELYACWITVGMALGLRREQMDQIVNNGLAIEPDYYPIYRAMAYDLMPRWHGKKGDAEAFAAASADRTKNIEGDGLYARIAYGEVSYGGPGDYLRDFKFDYKRIKKGCDDILKTYDNPIYVKNWYCFMACIHDDRETAKGLFDQIKDHWDNSVWKDRKSFDLWNKWAHGQGQRPKLESSRDRPTPEISSAQFPFLKNPGFWGLLILTPIVLVLLAVFLRQHR